MCIRPTFQSTGRLTRCALQPPVIAHVGHRCEHDARSVLSAWFQGPLLALRGYRRRLGLWRRGLFGQAQAGAVCCRSFGRFRGRASGWSFVASSRACPTFYSTGWLQRCALPPPVNLTLVIAVNMMRTSSSPLGFTAHCSPFAAIGGVWAAGSAANFGKRLLARYAAVRAGADADAQVVGHSWQVHTLCPTLQSSGRAKARRSSQR